ncbi:hypothetical protein [Rhodovulum adriaticum]|uniref:HsdM-like protein n=1 Tax=Rhodovulum adriaticum TaxID=35804 RepID=A0A4R2NE95_RHOAD|nr:hypothetical protein [Rhodovulum adriaticum]TCP19537.1 hypothetical protein EV656_1292 [Rhodovulum adriaticum]
MPLTPRCLSQDTINTSAAFIWSITERLCADFKQSEYGEIVLSFTILSRFRLPA